MEAVGAASAILAIATAGVQCSVKLVTFAGQVKLAPEQIGFVAEDVSLSASILQQLGQLAKETMEYEPRAPDENGQSDNDATNNNVKSVRDTDPTVSKQSIFNETGLETVISLAKKCEVIFESLNHSLRKASKQLHEKSGLSGKFKLSRAEMFKWPFLFPGIDTMRDELRNVKATLMLMLQVAMLAYSRRMMEEYGENQRSTAIVAYSREDQEMLVRSIVAAQKSQTGSPGKRYSEPLDASNVKSIGERPLKIERPRFSRFSGPSKQGLASVDRELNGIAENGGKNSDQMHGFHDEQPRDTGSDSSQEDASNNEKISLSRQPLQPASEYHESRVFNIYLVYPRASIVKQQVHISYEARIIKLSSLTIESQLQEWKAALNTTVLDQLATLNDNEYEALDATRVYSEQTILQEETLEWIHFGDYRTLIQGMEDLKARTLTIVMSKAPRPAAQFENTERQERKEKKEKDIKEEEDEVQEKVRTTWIKVHRKHLLPETLTAYNLPWEWDMSDANYLVIKRWITEDFQEELFAHTRRLRGNRIMTQTSVSQSMVNDRNKDNIFLVRKKPPPRRNSNIMSKIRQSLPFMNRHRQEQEDPEQELPYALEGDIKDEEFRERLRSQLGYTREEVENLLNRKTADEEKKRKEEIIEDQQDTDHQSERETSERESIEVLSESDDAAEGIVNALLTKYTM